jgi:hypothetical protein
VQFCFLYRFANRCSPAGCKQLYASDSILQPWM